MKPKGQRNTLISTIQGLRSVLTDINRHPSLTERERRVLTALALETIGFGRRTDTVATCRLVSLTGIDERDVWRKLKSLIEKGYVGAEGGGFRRGHVARRWINEDALKGGQSTHLCTTYKGGQSAPFKGGLITQTPRENEGESSKKHLSHQGTQRVSATSKNVGRGALKAPASTATATQEQIEAALGPASGNGGKAHA